MIKARDIVKNRESIIKSLENRFVYNPKGLIDKICELQSKKLIFLHEKESYTQRQKEVSDSVKEFFKNGEKEKGDEAKNRAIELKNKIEVCKSGLNEVEERLTELLLQVPNIPHDSVPVGNSEGDNIIIHQSGDVIKNDDKLPHWELSDKYDLIDFKRGVKLTGAGFPVYKGKCAKLQRALIQFFLDEASDSGYEEVQVPHFVNTESALGTGQLPDKDGQMYHMTTDNLYAIPTAEVPVTNLYRDEIVENLPIKNVAYTPCFRREAGSYGSDVKGLNRLHQFDKVEIVQIVAPENSGETLSEMCGHVEKLLNMLDLKWRKLKLCTGDLGFTSAITFDYEVYSEGQDKWLEVSSVSCFNDFQANRLNLRHRVENGTEMCHTLNGSALALPRILAAILESYQTDDGIDVPYALQKYLKFDIID